MRENGAAAVGKKSGREDATSWITGTKMDEMPTEKVKRGNEGLALGKDGRVFLRGCSRSCLVRP